MVTCDGKQVFGVNLRYCGLCAHVGNFWGSGVHPLFGVEDRGWHSARHADQHAAALEKLEVALNRYAVQHGTGREYSFSQAISGARATGKELDRFEGSRAYSAPR